MFFIRILSLSKCELNVRLCKLNVSANIELKINGKYCGFIYIISGESVSNAYCVIRWIY